MPEILDRDSIIRYCKEDIDDPNNLTEFWRMFSLLKWLEIYQARI
jgi:hypothetical protein